MDYKEIDYNNLSGWSWSKLITDNKELAKQCTKYGGWNKLDGSDWSWLIRTYKELSKQCTKYGGWGKMGNLDWLCLLVASKEFSKQCTKYGGWEKFDDWDWSLLLEVHKEFKKFRKQPNKELFMNKEIERLQTQILQLGHKIDDLEAENDFMKIEIETLKSKWTPINKLEMRIKIPKDKLDSLIVKVDEKEGLVRHGYFYRDMQFMDSYIRRANALVFDSSGHGKYGEAEIEVNLK